MNVDVWKRFRRVTYSTAYLPELDGLRFLAIFSVVVIMHITHYLNQEFFNAQIIGGGYLRSFTTEGGNGVPLFFMISGFILSLPFARWRLLGEGKVSLRAYFLRRLTRLEPPYLIALLLLFAAQVWILKQAELQDQLPHLLASAVYLHTLIYHTFSPVLPVAWSLEVEVQFYILAPLFCSIFLLRHTLLRRLLLTGVILASALCWYDNWENVHVFKFLHFFFCGLLLADLFCGKVVLMKRAATGWISGAICLAVYLFLPSTTHLYGYLAKMCAMFLLMHVVLTAPGWRKVFSIPLLVLIGGMCYTIYLLHLAIVSMTGHLLHYLGWVPESSLYFLPAVLAFCFVVLLISAVYFLLVEKPFMQFRRFLRPQRTVATGPAV